MTAVQRIAWWQAEEDRGTEKTFLERVFLAATFFLWMGFCKGAAPAPALLAAVVGGLAATGFWWFVERRRLARDRAGAPGGVPGPRVLRRERQWLDRWTRARARGREHFVLTATVVWAAAFAGLVVGSLWLFEPGRLRADPVRVALVPALFAPLLCLLCAGILFGIGERRFRVLSEEAAPPPP